LQLLSSAHTDCASGHAHAAHTIITNIARVLTLRFIGLLSNLMDALVGRILYRHTIHAIAAEREFTNRRIQGAAR
jgi:hypothetical protein